MMTSWFLVKVLQKMKHWQRAWSIPAAWGSAYRIWKPHTDRSGNALCSNWGAPYSCLWLEEEFHTYTYGRQVTVKWDHKCLEVIFKKPCTERQRDSNACSCEPNCTASILEDKESWKTKTNAAYSRSNPTPGSKSGERSEQQKASLTATQAGGNKSWTLFDVWANRSKVRACDTIGAPWIAWSTSCIVGADQDDTFRASCQARRIISLETNGLRHYVLS